MAFILEPCTEMKRNSKGRGIFNAVGMDIDVGDVSLSALTQSQQTLNQQLNMNTNIMSNAIGAHTVASSGRRTVKRSRGKPGMHALTVQNLGPVKVHVGEKGDQLKSSFAQFKKLFDGSSTLKNEFSFVIESAKGNRGVMVMPIRHDAVCYGMSPDSSVGGGVTAYADNYQAYAIESNNGQPDSVKHLVGDLNTTHASVTGKVLRPLTFNRTSGGDVGGPVYPGNHDFNLSATGWCCTDNMIVPGMSLLHLEQASWKLNQMKLIEAGKIKFHADQHDGIPVMPRTNLQILSNWDWAVGLSGTAYPSRYLKDNYDRCADNYISRRWNPARQQSALPKLTTLAEPGGTNKPTDQGVVAITERSTKYEVQIGKGSMVFDCYNEGETAATIELVLIKNKSDVYKAYDATIPEFTSPVFAENTMSWLGSVCGRNYVSKVLDKTDKVLFGRPSTLGSGDKLDIPTRQDVLWNPYVNFLPEAGFRNYRGRGGVYDPGSKAGNYGGGNALQDPSVDPYDNGYTSIGHHDNTGEAVDSIQNSTNTGSLEPGIIADPEPQYAGTHSNGPEGQKAAQLSNGQWSSEGVSSNAFGHYATSVSDASMENNVKCPYNVVGRSFAVIPAQCRRKIIIPLPKIRYDPSVDHTCLRLPDEHTLKAGMRATPLSKHGLQCIMSVNGARADYFSTETESKGTFKGQDFTPAKVFVDAVYSETVYPSCCTDPDLGTAFNLGRAFGTNLPKTIDVVPGFVAPLGSQVPVSSKPMGAADVVGGDV